MRPLEITGKAAKPLKKEGAIAHLSALTLRLKSVEEPQWSEEYIQTLLQAYVSENDIGFGKIGQPVRAALTGGAPSPDLSWVLALLGKTEVLGRLGDVIENGLNKKED
jgi:glutamyl-tRNA synthetase